jgi:aspartyl-tRNA(Asn)/glutamyl-tRNA(Gln) amidotransferase subunit A
MVRRSILRALTRLVARQQAFVRDDRQETKDMPDSQTDPALLPAHVLAADLAAGRRSSSGIVEACLARIDKHDETLASFVDVYADSARLAAEAADKAMRAGHRIGPLHGLPVAIKDIIEIEGKVTTGGAGIWRQRRSPMTATLVSRLIANGLIILGKLHTVEFALGGWGTNQTMGTPWNPWDAATPRTPGGSSSGAGVAVAACLVPWAVGTDTGGSIRLPSSWCGVTGLKATVGRVSRHGVLPLSPAFDSPGPMARCVEDVALLLDAMAGPDPRDPRTLHQPALDLGARTRRTLTGLRLAGMPAAERQFASAEVLAAYDRSLDVMADLGAEIVGVELPATFSDMVATMGVLMSADAYACLGPIVDDPALRLDEDVRPRILAGRQIPARDYILAERRRSAWKVAFAEMFCEVDALITPATASTALPLDKVDQTALPSIYTRYVNLLDLCALALPIGFSADGLPIGLQIACRGFDEATAVRIGRAFQAATDWHRRHPPCCRS